jgi:hypothetical protein
VGIEKERDMVKRWIAPALGLALALSVGMARPAAALRLKGMKPAAKGAAQAVGAQTVTGMIKGAPAGKTITVVSGKRTTSVDTSHARIRSKGKFASPAALTPGSFVRAAGSMNGTTLVATTVDIIRPAGGAKKAAGGKMTGGKKGKK